MSYTQLTANERYVIYHLKLCKFSLREIARRLGRHHTTISREIERNGPVVPTWVYWHEAANARAMKRKQQARHQIKYSNLVLRKVVRKRLLQDWSPEEISGRLRKDYQDQPTMHVSMETIYRWIYKDAQQGGILFNSLRRRHKKRRRQCRYGTGRRLIYGRASIHERPECVNQRERYGDWEGDTVEGKKGTGHIATHVERKSRYLIAAKLENKTSLVTATEVVAAYKKIPKYLRKTLTLDNGTEFSRFQEIERGTGMTIYFADPYAAWQRGCNENTNGLLRQYFPKGSSFENITKKSLAFAVEKLNHRPRKCLNYQTPYEVFNAAKYGALRM